jgi:hypothetical protein
MYFWLIRNEQITTTMKNTLNFLLPAALCLAGLSTVSPSSAQDSRVNGKIKIIRNVNGKTTVVEQDLNEKNCSLLLDSICKNMDIDIKTERTGKKGKLVNISSSCSGSRINLDSLMSGLDMSFNILLEEDEDKKEDGKAKRKAVIINGFSKGTEKDSMSFRFSFEGDNPGDRKGGHRERISLDNPGEIEEEETVIIEKKDGKIRKKTVIVITEPKKNDLKNQEPGSRERGAAKLEVSDLKLYPNPSDGNFRLSFSLPEKGDLSIRVTNIEGKVIYKEDVKDFGGKYEKQISLSENPANGIYFLNIEQNGKQLFKKILKQ